MNYSLNRYLEKAIDLLEMSPLENQFQDFIVYPILDGIIHESKVCKIDSRQQKENWQWRTPFAMRVVKIDEETSEEKIFEQLDKKLEEIKIFENKLVEAMGK